jgi:hypothetical protein
VKATEFERKTLAAILRLRKAGSSRENALAMARLTFRLKLVEAGLKRKR